MGFILSNVTIVSKLIGVCYVQNKINGYIISEECHRTSLVVKYDKPDIDISDKILEVLKRKS